MNEVDIEHNDINRIERMGFPNREYLSWELSQQQEAEEEIWPDGLRYAEWQKEKTLCGNREPYTVQSGAE